jgi:uncharacterized protein YbjT (DUF2867 family)
VRILILGVTGLIGGAVSARLAIEGDEVAGVSRGAPREGLSRTVHFALDIAQALTPQSRMPLLEGIDAVVNCAGTFQDTPGESTRGVHHTGIAALYTACERSGVRRVVHLSALGVDRSATAFSESKRQGDAALMARDLEWVILRPSVVIGRAAYGGSALMRGLAALPLQPMVPQTGALQPVWLGDLVQMVLFYLGPHAPSRVIVDMVSPRRWTFSDIVKVFRRWMRWRDAPVVPVPAWASASLYKLGDAISWLGWRPPVRSTAQREMAYGAVGEILSPRQRDGGHSSSASVPHARSCTSLPAWSATRSMLWRPRPALCIAMVDDGLRRVACRASMKGLHIHLRL